MRQLCRDGLRRYVVEAETALADDGDPWEAFAAFLRRIVAADVHSLTVQLAGTFSPTADMYRGRQARSRDERRARRSYEGTRRPERRRASQRTSRSSSRWSRRSDPASSVTTNGRQSFGSVTCRSVSTGSRAVTRRSPGRRRRTRSSGVAGRGERLRDSARRIRARPHPGRPAPGIVRFVIWYGHRDGARRDADALSPVAQGRPDARADRSRAVPDRA